MHLIAYLPEQVVKEFWHMDTEQVAPLPKLTLPLGHLDPHLMYGSISPPEFTLQMAFPLAQLMIVTTNTHIEAIEHW